MRYHHITKCNRTFAEVCQCENLQILESKQENIKAICKFSTSNTVNGILLFSQSKNNPTLIVGRITGLTPGLHGLHIHEFGDLSNGCESAGGHYNPDNVDHGNIKEGHVGDLGNVEANKAGIAEIILIAERIDLLGDRSVVGRSVVVHSDEDDLGTGGDNESLKTGNAGDRVACGVIVLKENK